MITHVIMSFPFCNYKLFSEISEDSLNMANLLLHEILLGRYFTSSYRGTFTTKLMRITIEEELNDVTKCKLISLFYRWIVYIINLIFSYTIRTYKGY